MTVRNATWGVLVWKRCFTHAYEEILGNSIVLSSRHEEAETDPSNPRQDPLGSHWCDYASTALWIEQQQIPNVGKIEDFNK